MSTWCERYGEKYPTPTNPAPACGERPVPGAERLWAQFPHCRRCNTPLAHPQLGTATADDAGPSRTNPGPATEPPERWPGRALQRGVAA